MPEVSTQERDAFIMECLDGGMSLSEVQNQLAERFDLHLTYMELRMLTADLQVNWSKQDAKAEAAKPKTKPAPAASAATPGSASAMPEEGSEAYGAPEGYPGDEEAPESKPAPAATDNALRGSTTVEVSKLVRPGAAVSGTVKFGSGASGEWYLDQFGRLGFIPDEGSGQPDQQDIQEFQVEVQKALGGY